MRTLNSVPLLFLSLGKLLPPHLLIKSVWQWGARWAAVIQELSGSRPGVQGWGWWDYSWQQQLNKVLLWNWIFCNTGEMNISKPVDSWTSYKVQLTTSHSSILNEIALGQKQNMSKDLRENLNTHDVTEGVERGWEVNIFSFFFFLRSENKYVDFFPILFWGRTGFDSLLFVFNDWYLFIGPYTLKKGLFCFILSLLGRFMCGCLVWVDFLWWA